MSAITIQQMADRVLRLMDEHLGARGTDVGQRLTQAARRLPRAERKAAIRLAQAYVDAGDPRRLLMIDEGQVAADYDLLLRHLSRPPSRVRAVAASVGQALLVSAALLGGVAFLAMAQV